MIPIAPAAVALARQELAARVYASAQQPGTSNSFFFCADWQMTPREPVRPAQSPCSTGWPSTPLARAYLSSGTTWHSSPSSRGASRARKLTSLVSSGPKAETTTSISRPINVVSPTHSWCMTKPLLPIQSSGLSDPLHPPMLVATDLRRARRCAYVPPTLAPCFWMDEQDLSPREVCEYGRAAIENDGLVHELEDLSCFWLCATMICQVAGAESPWWSITQSPPSLRLCC
jgi:hypothetical protein